MKRFGILLILLGLFAFGLGGCASTEEASTQSTAPRTSVPGEDVSGAGGLAPTAAPGGAGANVRF